MKVYRGWRGQRPTAAVGLHAEFRSVRPNPRKEPAARRRGSGSTSAASSTGYDALALYWNGGPPDEIPMTAKDTVRALLDRLPDDCSLDDVQYHLYVVQAVDRGVADGEAGRVIPHEQVAADLRRKWLLGSAK
jgi:hypothetical protein